MTSSRELRADNYGDLSAVLLLNIPAIGRMARVPKWNMALHSDWEEKGADDYGGHYPP